MAFVFLIFLVVIGLSLARWRVAAIVVALVNLLLALGILWYHWTTTLEIVL
jgi:hypothetical protein